MGKGQKLYLKAKNLIPGGNMLLSKRPEMHLPNQWPAYYTKAKGCKVWDLDSKKYYDCSIMGVGTNILGYGNEEVDRAVIETISKGNMSTLNCPEEVELAEKLIDLDPWADMVRFARTGGEANAIAIRIARAASGKDKVAVCGYHGWHDWYLSVNHNHNGENLDQHLLPGLEPNGVPLELKNTVFPFEYNNLDQLEKIISKYDIGVIKMEVVRNEDPKFSFLQKVRKIATKNNIVLIFDECTSGFRETFGGIYKKYNVIPDIIMYGKTLGNGYAITAVVGKREIMEFAQKTFISSTFWTERIGPTAALKTLEVMQKERSWEIITNIGCNVQENWKKIADKHNVKIKIFGIPALSSFIFLHPNHLQLKTYLTQEFLKKGFLASNLFYISISHSPEILKKYFTVLDEVFFQISKIINNDYKVGDFLDGEVCHSGFNRLN